MSKFTEAKLEAAIIELFALEGYTPLRGEMLEREAGDVLLKDDLRKYLFERYREEVITAEEVERIIQKLEVLASGTIYEANKAVMRMVADGFVLKREDRSKQPLFIELIDYRDIGKQQPPAVKPISVGKVAESDVVYGEMQNIFRIVTQLEIVGSEKRIPDAIVYINGLPLVVCEFKSAIREEATIADAYTQLTVRYRRDIPELFKYNAFCVISDGVNTKVGSFFAEYEYFYAWRRVSGDEEREGEGIDSLYSMIAGLFNQRRLKDVIRNFIFFPDTSDKDTKIVCRYPQYYAARKLFNSILKNRHPHGDGRGGTYFGATGSGKSYTMLYLTRLLMKSVEFSSPTIVLISDRVELDDQLSRQFVNAKEFIGDAGVVSVKSREELRTLLKGRKSGGVFLTTVHKFTEDTELLTRRSNVICISDEAHRSQVNLEQKVKITAEGVQRTYGFAKYLRDSLPNATYVGFTGTPIDATMDVFGKVVDAYTMAESVADEITVKIVYEGRAAKVLLDSDKLQEIEKYYEECVEEGASEYAIDASKRANARLTTILGDPSRLRAVAADFVTHYEKRVSEGATIIGKAMFVCSSRPIAYELYKYIAALRPEWLEVKECGEGERLTEEERKKIKPMERIKMIMIRDKDDPPELYKMLGSSDDRKELDRQFKTEKSNFKVAIVVDMWLTGFDIPCLDTMYIDKPIQRHTLIQTISRVNRMYQNKDKGLIVDYIGIKKQMGLALAQYNKADSRNFEEVEQSVKVVKDHLDLLNRMFRKFDATPFFYGSPLEQLQCLNMAAEFVQVTDESERRFMGLTRRLKAAYDICCGGDSFTEHERDQIHFYLAVRSIIYKLTKGDAPDVTQMNNRVKQMIEEALASDGVEEILKLGSDEEREIDLFSDDYLEKLSKIKLPNTKVKLLLQLLKKAIGKLKKTNKMKSIEFAKAFKALVEQYNARKEQDILVGNVVEDFSNQIIDLLQSIQGEAKSFEKMGVSFEEKAFYDILKALMVKYEFDYPEEKLIMLAREVKVIVDDKARYPDWNKKEDIKAELKVELILLLAKHGYPPVDRDEVYKEVLEQAENFKKYRC